jgi:hyaluronoglucosaminidase
MQTDIAINAGVIEGFFGKSWEWQDRLSCIDFLRDSGYRFYVYAPKADPFLRRRWREPLPAQTLQHLSDLNGRCRARGLSLGIGLTPFEIYLNYDGAAQRLLRSKVEQINDLGPELLCILFDDMRGDVEQLPDLQAKVIADMCAWSNAERFIVVPTYYSYDPLLARAFGSPPKTYLRDFGRLVDPRIDIFWTGEKVISAGYSAVHLSEVAAEIGRKPFIWDNYISNDSKIRTNHLYLDPTSGSWELPANLAAGLAINPMNQPYLSRIALRGYRNLLTQDPVSGRAATIAGARTTFADICRDLCGPPFAQRLVSDLDLLQKTGLNQLDPETRRGLLDWYGSQQSNPYANDIASWLRGEYVFDPQCLTV